jgi:hypothetical protein
MWREDLFEGKWSMLAKAYSILRGDREKTEVPLQDYFSRCAPLIGVIPPQHYQRLMGWELGPPAEHDQVSSLTSLTLEMIHPVGTSADSGQAKIPTIKRVFVPTLDSFPEAIISTVLSVDDLVKHCIDTGLVRTAAVANTTAQHGALTMAVQPTTTAAVSEDVATGANFEEMRAALSADIATSNASDHAADEVALHNAALTLDATSAFPHAAAFNPAGEFDITFDPTGADPTFADGGFFDSFDMNSVFATNGTNNMQFEFAGFLNDEQMS